MPSSSLKSPSPPPVGCYGTGASNTINGQGISLTDLLMEAELEQYEEALRLRLKVGSYFHYCQRWLGLRV